MELRNKVALVTGAGPGIGKAAALNMRTARFL
jgi:NAD(P)-dependent dehydrogenase (short-subunit alcohol dehydrogenase family)